jgi:hypothetical protein
MVAFAIFKGYPKKSAVGLLLKRGIRPGTLPPEEDLRKTQSARVKTPEKKIAGWAEKILPQLHFTGAEKTNTPGSLTLPRPLRDILLRGSRYREKGWY